MDSARLVLDLVGAVSLLSAVLAPLLPAGRPRDTARAIGLALPEALRIWRNER